MIAYWKKITYNMRQILAIAEKNFKMSIRFKASLLMSYINPIIQLIFPLIIMGKLFSLQESFGPWNARNYLVYLFIGYNIILLQRISGVVAGSFSIEKFWGTLQALMIAPFNRFNLLIGFIISHIIEISIPFSIFLIIVYVFFPISIITLIAIIGMAISILLTFAGIGLIIGVFQISNENIAKALTITLSFIMTFSCISYPYQVFPLFIQQFVNLNPMYYIIDIIRLTWIEDNIYLTISSHLINAFIMFSCVIIFPIIGIFMFNLIFKKYGIVGY